jgi:TetR/AcrR family transcriptional regulator, transcriptional repressor for nem operon
MQTRDRIVRSAAKLFLTRSYQSVGVGDLCAAADVRKGSFYHFFPSKAELAKAVVDLHAGELERRMAAGGERAPAARLIAIADAVTLIQTGFEKRFGRIVGCPFGNLAAELSTTDDELRAHLAGVFARWQRTLATACRDAADAGALRGGRSGPARRQILAQIQGLILLAKVCGGPATEITDGLHSFIKASLVEQA